MRTNIRDIVDSVVTALMAAAALTVCGFYLFDRFSHRDPASARQVDNWPDVNEAGLWIGSPQADVVITEFVDFQCPYCRQVAPVIDSLLSAEPNRVALVFHHYPLGNHPQAMPAAVAVECAARQGRALELSHRIFAKQDSLGMKTFTSYAEDASMPNLGAFADCLTFPQDSFPRIGIGLRYAGELEAPGTPWIWVNGRESSRASLPARVAEALASGAP